MSYLRTWLAGLAAVSLLVAACSSSGSSTAPLVTTAGPGAPSAGLAAPHAPTAFTATPSGYVPCPSADDPCSQVNFAWQAGADPETGFRIYVASTGEGPDATCLTEQPNATVRLEPGPAERTAQAFDPMAVGGGQMCYWITAVSGAGESAQVAAAGN